MGSRLGRRSFALGATILVAACFGAASASQQPPANRTAERVWINNAVELITQLDQDVLTGVTDGSDLPTARYVLGDPSQMMFLLVANVDFGSCHETVRNMGVLTARLRHVARTLASACVSLERASTLFTRAATNSDPRPLLASARVTLKAVPLLQQATAELQAIRGR